MRPQLFRPRYDASVALLSQATQRQFQAARVEVGILRDAVSLVENDNRARFHVVKNPTRYLRRIALDRIEASNRPADQGHPATFQFRMHEQILQSNGCPEKTRGTIRTGAQLFCAKIDLQPDPARAGAPESPAWM
jgi:hypothetical protein